MWPFIPFAAYILHIFIVAGMDPIPKNTYFIYSCTVGVLFLLYTLIRNR